MYANRCRDAPVQNLHRLTGTSVSRRLFRARGVPSRLSTASRLGAGLGNGLNSGKRRA